MDNIDVKRETIAFNGSETCYKVKVGSFIYKMVSSEWTGRVIRSNPFKHNDVQLSLKIYPNGQTQENQGQICLAIKNESNTPITIEGVMSIGYLDRIINFHIEPSHSIGFPFVDTLWFTTIIFGEDESDDDEDEYLEVSLLIKNLVKGNNNEQKVNSVSSVNGEHEKIETMRKGLRNKEVIKSLSKFCYFDVNLKSFTRGERHLLLPKPECPVCFEEMPPPSSRIAQCLSGHHICWSCKERITECPSCKLPVNGRAFGMENYLNTLFN